MAAGKVQLTSRRARDGIKMTKFEDILLALRVLPVDLRVFAHQKRQRHQQDKHEK